MPHGGLHRPCRCRALRGGGAVRNTRKEGIRRPERSTVAGRSELRAPSALVGAALAVPTRIGDFTYGATLSLIIRGRAVVSWVKKRRGRRPLPAKRQRFVELGKQREHQCRGPRARGSWSAWANWSRGRPTAWARSPDVSRRSSIWRFWRSAPGSCRGTSGSRLPASAWRE